MQKTRRLHPILNFLVVLTMCGFLSACVGTVVGVVVDTTIEVVKIPFKVAGAVIDVATPDKSSDKKKPKSELDVDE